MGQGRAARQRRVVWHYSFKRKKRDNMTLNKQIERAEQVAAGNRPVKKDRFVALTGDKPGVDWNLVERARTCLGYKGYVTNIPAGTLDGPSVVAAYHDLFQVERSFRMAKSDLRARPIFHHTRDSIEAHLTIVFAALAIARHLQAVTGVSIRRIVQELRLLRDVTVTIAGHSVVAVTPPSPAAKAILEALSQSKSAH
jgi:transposase